VIVISPLSKSPTVVIDEPPTASGATVIKKKLKLILR
jgi:hypothetical protein